MPSLADARVLVTGAGRGIGAACARAFATAGARVACADIRAPGKTLASLGDARHHSVAVSCDVSDEESVRGLFQTIDDRFRGLEVLVHCAGIIHEQALLKTAAADFDRVIAVNLRGSFLVGREAIRMMSGEGGRIIMIASDLSYAGRETFSAYVASKHGVLGLVRSWAKEFAPGIRVNAICPGPIDTAMLSSSSMSPEWREREKDVPLQRFGQPEEVAAIAAILAGPSGDFITGQGIGINGGSVMV